jgi:hypothetical protein
MPSDLEIRLRAARPPLPEPGPAAERRARRALDLPLRVTGVASWLRRPSRRGMRLIAVAAALAAGGGALAATLLRGGESRPVSEAIAAPLPRLGWGEPESLSRPITDFDRPDAAVSRRGHAIAVWQRGGLVEARFRPPRGQWGPVATLSTRGDRAKGPQVAMSDSGDAIAVWRQRRGGRVIVQRFTLPGGAPAGEFRARVAAHWVVQARSRPAGGAWSTAIDLSSRLLRVDDARETQVGVSGDGTATVLWNRADRVEARTRTSSGGWGSIENLGSPAGTTETPRLAVSRNGTTLAVWAARTSRPPSPPSTYPGRAYVVHAAFRPAGGAWSRPEAISSHLGSPPRPRIAVDDAGRALVVWDDYAIATSGAGLQASVAAATRDSSGTWTRTTLGVRLGSGGQGPKGPRIVFPFGGGVGGIDGRGTGVALVGAPRVAYAVSRPGAEWSRARALGTGAGSVAVSGDGDGRLVAIIGEMFQVGRRAFRSRIAARTWDPARQRWTRPETIGRFGNDLAVAAGPRGMAVAIWLGSSRRGSIVRAVVRDPLPLGGGSSSGGER